MKPFLQSKFGVEEIALFGSYARGEGRPDSDIDILVKMNNRSLTNYFGLLDFLEAKLNKKIDLVTKHKNLPVDFLNLANRDIVYV
ncbi:MAG TPA: nucleotidyltransferase family protein [Sphingobacterium sp.]|nr:nucleotidyltransferase family protein [Sphingobacterium sp.]